MTIFELDFPCGCHTDKFDPRKWHLCAEHETAKSAICQWAATGAVLYRERKVAPRRLWPTSDGCEPYEQIAREQLQSEEGVPLPPGCGAARLVNGAEMRCRKDRGHTGNHEVVTDIAVYTWEGPRSPLLKGGTMTVGVCCGSCGGNLFMVTCDHFRGTGHEWLLASVCMICRAVHWTDDGCLDCKAADELVARRNPHPGL